MSSELLLILDDIYKKINLFNGIYFIILEYGYIGQYWGANGNISKHVVECIFRTIEIVFTIALIGILSHLTVFILAWTMKDTFSFLLLICLHLLCVMIHSGLSRHNCLHISDWKGFT